MLALITGGSGSGKSEYAETLAQSLGKERIYLAAMIPWDEECRERIRRHRNMRKEKGFVTIERYTGLAGLELPSGGADVILLECMSNLTANEYYANQKNPEKAGEAVMDGICHLSRLSANLVIVTNEVFSDGREYDPETAGYQELLGKLNRELGQLADTVTEVVYGIPVVIKGEK